MADLAELMGSILASLAHARRIADEETAAIAEHYRDNPLLEGMSMPRIRVPEMTLDIPLVIDDHEEGEADEAEDPDRVRREMRRELERAARDAEMELPSNLSELFDHELAVRLRHVRAGPSAAGMRIRRPAVREGTVRAVSSALDRALERAEVAERPQASTVRRLRDELRRKADEVAVKRVGRPPRIGATIETAEVKERANSENVTRIRLTLREEGLEWSAVEDEEGVVSRRLTPE